MALHDRPARLTYDDFLRFSEDGLRHEILDGEHYVSASPYVRHQVVSMQLALIVGAFVTRHRLGLFLSAPIDVILSPSDIVVPDFAFVSKEHLDIVTPANIQGPPDLLIEILSPSTKRVDQGIKLARYERFGVQEYWIVDPDRNTVTIHRLEEGAFQVTPVLRADVEDVLRTPFLPGLEIRLADVFA